MSCLSTRACPGNDSAEAINRTGVESTNLHPVVLCRTVGRWLDIRTWLFVSRDLLLNVAVVQRTAVLPHATIKLFDGFIHRRTDRFLSSRQKLYRGVWCNPVISRANQCRVDVIIIYSLVAVTYIAAESEITSRRCCSCHSSAPTCGWSVRLNSDNL